MRGQCGWVGEQCCISIDGEEELSGVKRGEAAGKWREPGGGMERVGRKRERENPAVQQPG